MMKMMMMMMQMMMIKAIAVAAGSLAAGSLVSQGCRQREQVAAMDPEGQAARQREPFPRLVEQELRLVAQALGNQPGTSPEERARIVRAFNMAMRQLQGATMDPVEQDRLAQELRLVARALVCQAGTSQEDLALIVRAFHMAMRQLRGRTH